MPLFNRRKVDQHPRRWQSCPLQRRNTALPSESGVYAVVRDRQILYIGKSKNLRDRWQGRSHHRYEQLHRMGRCRLHWVKLHPQEIHAKEHELMNRWHPSLNGTPVPTYPRWPLTRWPWRTIVTGGLLALITLFPVESINLATRLADLLFPPTTEQPGGFHDYNPSPHPHN